MPATHSFEPYTYEVPLDFYWKVYNSRFPKHELFPFILDSEVTELIVEENGNEKSTRKTKLDIDAPGWFKTLFSIHYSIFIEESYYDKENQKITIKTINETLSSKAKMIDITVYQVHPTNPNWCTFTQTGTVELLVSVLGFQKKIEKYVLDLYKSRYDESRELDKKMIERYKQDVEAKNNSSNNNIQNNCSNSSENNTNTDTAVQPIQNITATSESSSTPVS
ncbi:hypothetical protein CYY_004877 [Polysphondylium violaceum]|uniref:PRELI/MSF1 domain-containing protein n=1 Tax=Polysphondylium violaceum TaxID=133409 RepID=A0A8J4PW34_9MYCE|nr:hypothetical protein CYY_004877 [Polysphondylium violaceum]